MQRPLIAAWAKKKARPEMAGGRVINQFGGL
jgi:hypothetical protein